MSPEATTEFTSSREPAGAGPGGAGPAPAGREGAVRAAEFPELPSGEGGGDEPRGDPERNIELLRDVALRVKVELGRGKMRLRDVLRLTEGSVVELEKLAGDPLEIYVNDRLVAKGEILVLNENFCVRITQIFSPEQCLRMKVIS